MTEKKINVIAGLSCCIMRNPDDKLRCTECPYRFPLDANCLNRLKMDALEVLTELDEEASAPETKEHTCGPDYCEIGE